MKVKMIVAMDDQRFIGKNGELPWRLSADMSRFRNLTIADGYNAVIMGRKTWDSLPIKPLPKRNNIVLSSTKQAGVITYDSLDNCLNELKKQHLQKIFVIGGRSIYKIFFYLADFLHISFIHIIKDEVNEFFPISLNKIQLEFKKRSSKELSEMVTYTRWKKSN